MCYFFKGQFRGRNSKAQNGGLREYTLAYFSPQIIYIRFEYHFSAKFSILMFPWKINFWISECQKSRWETTSKPTADLLTCTLTCTAQVQPFSPLVILLVRACARIMRLQRSPKFLTKTVVDLCKVNRCILWQKIGVKVEIGRMTGKVACHGGGGGC